MHPLIYTGDQYKIVSFQDSAPVYSDNMQEKRSLHLSFCNKLDLICFFLCQVCYINVADTCISSLRLLLRQHATSRHSSPFSVAKSTTSSNVIPSQIAVINPSFILPLSPFLLVSLFINQVFLCLNCYCFFISITSCNLYFFNLSLFDHFFTLL